MTHEVKSLVIVRLFAAAMRETMAEGLRMGKIRKILMPVFRLHQTRLVPDGASIAFAAFVRSWDIFGAGPE